MTFVLGIVIALLLMFILPEGMLALVSSWAVSIHEVCHGLAAIFTGGAIVSLDVQWEHGLAMTQGGWYPVVSIFGYVGTAVVGALFFMAAIHRWARTASILFLITATLLLCIYASFGTAFFFAVVANIVVAACLWYERKGVGASMFATLLLYPQWSDVKQLLWYQPMNTDAGLLAQHFGMPWLAWPLALIYTTGTVLVWYFAIRYLVNHGTGKIGTSAVTNSTAS